MLKIKYLLLLTLCVNVVSAKEVVELLPFADFNAWGVRYIKESSLLGGKTKVVYNLGPTDTIRANVPYDYKKTIWGISNAYANVLGIAKAAVSTQPERRGNGYCARLDSRMESVQVLGVINLHVAIAGTLFFGKVVEPVAGAEEPYKTICLGIPFTKRPKAVQLDIKAKVSPEHTLTKATGFLPSTISGHDCPQVYLYLQKRWEGKDGKIYAQRIGTAAQLIQSSIPQWENNFRIPVQYGKLSNPIKNAQLVERGQMSSVNSKGQVVDVIELGWADANEQPTHAVFMVSSGCYPAFYTHIGNTLWVDNISFVY